MLLMHHMVNQKVRHPQLLHCGVHAHVHVVICNIKGLEDRAVLNLFGFLVEHLQKSIFSVLRTLHETGKNGKREEENSSAKRLFCLAPNNELETLLQFSCSGVWFLFPLVYENVDVRFKGDIVSVGLLHGSRDSICKLMKYIPADSLSDATCQGNELSIVLRQEYYNGYCMQR